MGFYLSRYLNSYLATPETSQSAPAQECPSTRSRSVHHRQAPESGKAHKKSRARIQSLSFTPPGLENAPIQRATFHEACRHHHHSRPRHAHSSTHRSCGNPSCIKHRLCKAQSTAGAHGLITMQTTASQSSRSLCRCACAQDGPHPCARKTVLRSLSQCSKGRRKFEGPLWLESPEPKRQRSTSMSRPSAAMPVIKNGVILAFVPRQGQLNGGMHSRAPEAGKRRCPTACSAVSPQPLLQVARPAPGTPSAQGVLSDPPLQGWEQQGQHLQEPASKEPLHH